MQTAKHLNFSYTWFNNHKSNNYKIDNKPRLIKIDNKNKLEIYTKSKVYLLDYIVNSNVTEDIPDNIIIIIIIIIVIII